MNDKQIRDAIKVCENCLKEYDRLLQYYTDKTVSDLKDEYRSIISRWYASIYTDSADPHIYNRQRSLFKAFRVQAKNGNIDVEYDSDFMNGYSHRVSNDYIFENSFVKGYHGGADNGPEHPAPGIPYWKKWRDYSSWGRPATRSESPYELMEKQYNKIMGHSRKLFSNAVNRKIIAPLQDVINKLGR